MSRFKLFAFIALITLAFGLVLVADALAGEKVKFRNSMYLVKWEPVNVGDEEGHVVATYEGKGIITNLEGKPFADGWLNREMGLLDMNLKTGDWTGQGYTEITDRDGDKIWRFWKGKSVSKDLRKGETTFIKGTGKYEGIRGKGTFASHPLGDRWYSDIEAEVELPKR